MRTYELHATAKQVGRSSGRSSVAAAAYRSASIMYDERTGLTHVYTDKHGVEFSRIYAPDNAPDWAHDRAKLWNAVEAIEKKSNATTAHELELAFPAEFNAMQRREAGDSMSREIMSRYHNAVDISYHEPHWNGDKRNFHAHIMFTTRSFDMERENGWARTKYRDLSQDYAKDEDGKFIIVDDKKVTRGSLEISSLREFAANEMNRIAQRDGLDVHTEYLSFEARGIDKEATQHLGYQASDMEKKGKQSRRGDINREIRESNDNRDKLTAQQKVISLAHEREKREFLKAIRQAEKQEQTSSDKAANALALAEKHKDFAYHKNNLDDATVALKEAQEKLENIKFFDRVRLQKKHFEQDVLDKQKNYEDAQARLKELVSAEMLEMKNKQNETGLEREKAETIKPKSAQERTEEARLYERDQKELKALEEALNTRSNIDRVIGSITGKSKEVQAKIMQLKEDIKSYEAEKQQFEQQQQQTQTDQKQTLHQQQVSQQANDNLNVPDITKHEKEPFKKKKILDSRSEWELAGRSKLIEDRVIEMQKEANLPKSSKPETPYTTLTPEEIQKNVDAQQAHAPTPQSSFYDGLSEEHREMLERHKADKQIQEQAKQQTQGQSKDTGQDISGHEHD